ncbi:MAG: AAA domain-containing protein, partial [Bacteroidia bacterium]|nr:AAA domain-containing protein [Bacteroidia bacterium]
MTPQEQLQHLLEILAIEKEEDMKMYRDKVLQRSLKERVKTGFSWYPVRMGKAFVGMGERWTVEVDAPEGYNPEGQAFQTGAMVSLFGNEADRESGRLMGVVTQLRNTRMRISLGAENLPEWLTRSKLGVDIEFDDKTYQEMEAALRKAIEPGKNRRLAELRDILLGTGPANFHRWEIEFHHPALNQSQNQAIQKTLEALDVAIIHGPPGTGKTTTMVQAIKEIVRHENQVLVCAPSNTAVDLLTLRCHQEGIHVVRMGNPARVEEELQMLTLDSSITRHPDYAALKKLRKDAEELRKQAAKHSRKDIYDVRQRRGNLFREARELRDMARQLEDYILHQTIQHAEVIACTLTGAANSLVAKRKFHTVLIDEAGQALAPACWIPLIKAQRVIMAGDHMQLPPTVKSYAAGKAGLYETLFETVINNKPETSVMLNQQYRMHEQIMNFSARKFYDANLHADPSVRFRGLGEGFSAVEFIDTAGCGFTEKRHNESRSLYNEEEAQLVLRHLATLLKKIQVNIPDTIDEHFTIGIISPYKAQVQMLQDQFAASPMLEEFARYTTIKTVDGFQGQERDVMYISLTRSNDKGEIGFLGDTRRMNVALTRARKKLVVIG